jgi:hypothetical protein
MLITNLFRVLRSTELHYAAGSLLKEALNNLFVVLWKERWPVANKIN